MLKSIGVVRKVDELGRIVLPIELRRTMNIEQCNPLEIYTDGERIILQKYQPGCTFCGTITGGSISHGGKNVCPDCIKQLQKQYALDRVMSKRIAKVLR